VVRRGGVLEDFADVVEHRRVADIAAQDGKVPAAGDVGDLALLDPDMVPAITVPRPHGPDVAKLPGHEPTAPPSCRDR